ncbi:MAG: hypothetical protein DCF15_03755 [Phormidesmis priestleyi]|uniref:SH3b domain-containing protein n=1 Tax=Phormidesmis priestleyi TaxID=268141 RepID=A0A2W4ZLS8_9CYAN|nr:MAG: hypothetical protein DCF15_03755 [Phormidesmis priestleyi]
MKRLLTNLLSSLLFGAGCATALNLATPQSAWASPERGWVSTTLDGGSANLRAAPTTGAGVLATLRNGSPFNIISERFDAAGYKWYQAQPTTINLTNSLWIRSDLVSLVAPFPATPRLSCDAAIAQTEQQIRAVPNTRIETRNQRSHGYTDGPANRPSSFTFILAGSGGNNVLASPVLMNAMASKLIENCATTGLVAFSVGAGDSNYLNYGAMPERLVRPFQCKLGPNSDRGPAKWGEQICL